MGLCDFLSRPFLHGHGMVPLWSSLKNLFASKNQPVPEFNKLPITRLIIKTALQHLMDRIGIATTPAPTVNSKSTVFTAKIILSGYPLRKVNELLFAESAGVSQSAPFYLSEKHKINITFLAKNTISLTQHLPAAPSQLTCASCSEEFNSSLKRVGLSENRLSKMSITRS